VFETRPPLAVVIGPLSGQLRHRMVVRSQLDPQVVSVADVQHPAVALLNRHTAMAEGVAVCELERNKSPATLGGVGAFFLGHMDLNMGEISETTGMIRVAMGENGVAQVVGSEPQPFRSDERPCRIR
jgi:hypothetical protein